jgi:hypothetical protein
MQRGKSQKRDWLTIPLTSRVHEIVILRFKDLTARGHAAVTETGGKHSSGSSLDAFSNPAALPRQMPRASHSLVPACRLKLPSLCRHVTTLRRLNAAFGWVVPSIRARTRLRDRSPSCPSTPG